MPRERTVQRDCWDLILPENVRRMSPQLAAIDSLLDDEPFLKPLRVEFTSTRSRPTIPMEVYLRVMYLKFRYKLGYEALVAEVSNNISRRLFCRVGLSGPIPEASTLCKLTCGKAKAAIGTLNDALLTKLVEQGTIKGAPSQRHHCAAGQHRVPHGYPVGAPQTEGPASRRPPGRCDRASACPVHP
jgi:transposase, IS5 family